jgi:hypothetical protein
MIGTSRVWEYCREPIEIAGKGGRFIIFPSTRPENPQLDTFKAKVEAINEYGYYN